MKWMLRDPVLIIVYVCLIGAAVATYCSLDLGDRHDAYNIYQYNWGK